MPDHDTKSTVINAAVKLIRARGYESVTIADICNEAGISKNTFYYHFKSKDNVMLGSFMTIPRELRAEQVANIIQAENHYEKYWLMYEPMIDFFESAGKDITRRVLTMNMLRDVGTFKKPMNDDLIRLEASILKKGQEVGEFRNTSEPEHIIHLAFSAFMGKLALWCMNKIEFDLKNHILLLLETTLDVKPDLRKANYNINIQHGKCCENEKFKT